MRQFSPDWTKQDTIDDHLNNLDTLMRNIKKKSVTTGQKISK
jgi:hypothetical protein